MAVEETLIIEGETADAVQALDNLERAAESASESMEDIATQSNTASQSLTSNLAPSVDVVAQSTAAAEAKITKLVGILGSAASAISALTATNKSASEETKRLAEGFAAVATAAGSGAAAFGPYGAVIGGIVAGITLLIQSLDRAEAAHDAAAAAIRRQTTDLSALMQLMGDQEQTRRLEAGLASVAEQTAAAASEMAELAAANVIASRSSEALTRVQGELADVEDRLRNRHRLRNHEVRELQEQERRLTIAVHEAAEANDTAGFAVDDLVISYSTLNAALRISEERQEAVTEATEATTAAAQRSTAAQTERTRKRLEGIREENQAAINSVALAHDLAEERAAIGERLLAAEIRQREERNAAVQAAVDLDIRLVETQIQAAEAAAQASAAADLARINTVNELRNEALINTNAGIDSYIQSLNAANEAAQEMGMGTISAMQAAEGAVVASVAEMASALGGQLAAGFAAAIKAAIKGEKSFGDALASMLEDTLFSIGQQALVLSIFEFAKAIADAASLNAAGAAAHAAAGVAFAAVAALGFGGGAALSAANAPPPPAAGPPAAAGGGPGTSTTEGGAVTNITYIFPGTPLGSTSDDLVRQFNRLDRLNTRREGRR